MRTVVMVAKTVMYLIIGGAAVFSAVLVWDVHQDINGALQSQREDFKRLEALAQEQAKERADVVVSESRYAKDETKAQAADAVRNLLVSMLPLGWRDLNDRQTFWKRSEKHGSAEFADVGIFQYQPDGRSRPFAVLPYPKGFGDELDNSDWQVMMGWLDPSAEIVNAEGVPLPREALLTLSGKLVAAKGRFRAEDQAGERVLFHCSRLELKQLSH